MSMIIFRFNYDDASMYVLTSVLPYSCAHTKVYEKIFIYVMPTFVPSYSDTVHANACGMYMCENCDVFTCAWVYVCIYALMCVGKCVYLYVDEGIFQMFVCEQSTFTAHCMHSFIHI